MATLGSTPKIRAHLATSWVISTRSSSLGSMLMAQSPMASTWLPPVAKGRTRMKQEDTILLPGLVFTSWRAGRTVSAVERADIAVLIIDAVEGVTEQDAKIAGIAHDRGKAVIIAVNKWDAIEKDNQTVKEYTQKIRQVLSFMSYAEIMFISAVSGQRMMKLYDVIDAVNENHSMRIATGVLNEIVTEAVALQQPPSDKGKRLRIYYTTQVAVKPPTFVIFVNDKELMHFSYVRYLENKIRESFGFKGTALKFIIRERSGKEG